MEGLERSKASLSSKLAVAQEEAAHLKAELGDHSSQTAKLKAQLHSIHNAHSKVSRIRKLKAQLHFTHHAHSKVTCITKSSHAGGQGCCAPLQQLCNQSPLLPLCLQVVLNLVHA